MLRRDIKDTSAVKDALESANEERGKEFESRSKVLAHLLPNATESRERLKGIIKKIEAKIATLKEAFDAMKKEKENKYQLLLRKKEVNLSQQSEEVDVADQGQARRFGEKISRERSASQKVFDSHQQSPPGEPRSYYTKRILDYLHSIGK